MSCHRIDREAPGQIDRSPLRSVEGGERVVVEGGGQGDRKRQGQTQGGGIVLVGFSFCLSLFWSFWSWRRGTRKRIQTRKKARRGEGKQRGRMGGESVCGGNALPQLVEMTKRCGERREGTCERVRVAVSLGIPWIYPRDRARRKVDREGEPKQRCK